MLDVYDGQIRRASHGIEVATNDAQRADAYCNRAQSFLRDEDYDSAARELEKSVELGVSGDGCSCEPSNSLAFIYIDVTRQYDRCWDLVHKTQGWKRKIASEYVERLKKASGRAG